MPDWPSLVERVGLPAVLLLIVSALCWKLMSKMLEDKNAEIARLRAERDHFRDRAESLDDRRRRNNDH